MHPESVLIPTLLPSSLCFVLDLKLTRIAITLICIYGSYSEEWKLFHLCILQNLRVKLKKG